MNLHKLPTILRARGFHLYDKKGTRYLDFYQDNGRAILGHKPANVSTELKNTLSRGLLGRLPSIYGYRLEKALRSLLPEYTGVRIFEHPGKVKELLLKRGILAGDRPIPDPLFSRGEGQDTVAVWRPFVEKEVEFPDIIVPLLPFPGGFSPGIVCFRRQKEDILPPSDICSPFLLAGLTRIVYDLIKEIEFRERDSWGRFDIPGWNRKGPYLIPDIPENEYGEVFRKYLDGGLLFHPSHRGISIIPGEFSPGEIKILQRRS